MGIFGYRPPRLAYHMEGPRVIWDPEEETYVTDEAKGIPTWELWVYHEA